MRAAARTRVVIGVATLVVATLAGPCPAQASGVVGTGTAGSCTDAALNVALTGGGLVTFSCGGSATIDISPGAGGTGTKIISLPTTIDGSGGAITLSGGNAVRVISVSAGWSLTLKNLTIANGSSSGFGGGIASNGALTATNCAFNNNASIGSFGGGIGVGAGTATVTNCTFTNNVSGSGGGVGIFNITGAGQLTVANSTFTSNTSSGGSFIDGGGIGVAKGTTATVTNSTFTGNSATGSLLGGGIATFGTLAVANCTFSSNSAGGFGGGIAVGAGGTSTVTTSTFTNNSSYGGGGGIGTANFSGGTPGGRLTVTNSTFSLNKGNTTGINANYVGGGIGVGIGSTTTITNSTFMFNSLGAGLGGGIGSGGTVEVTNCTLTGNSAGAGSGGSIGIVSDSTLKLTNSIIANTPSGPNCAGPVTDGGHNLQFPGTSCGASITSADPLLDPSGLANNGGLTQTIGLQPGSPAVNAGDETVCAAPPVNNLDQRGFLRPGTGATNCSIGAYEFDSLESLMASGTCEEPGTSGLVPCAAGTQITVSLCGTASCVAASRVVLGSTVVNADGTFSFVLNRQQVAGKRLIFRATITQNLGLTTGASRLTTQDTADVTYDIIDFGPVAADGQFNTIIIDPISEAAVQLLQNTGLENFTNDGIQQVVSEVRSADEFIDFGGVSADAAVSLATQTAQNDPMVQQTIQSTFVCRGDCNSKGSVAADDVLKMVTLALGLAQLDECDAGDVSGDRSISVDEILTTVTRAVNGCGSPAH